MFFLQIKLAMIFRWYFSTKNNSQIYKTPIFTYRINTSFYTPNNLYTEGRIFYKVKLPFNKYFFAELV